MAVARLLCSGMATERRTIIADTNIVDGMEGPGPATSEDWSGEVQLSQRFHVRSERACRAADRRGIAMLSNNSLALIFTRCLPTACRA